MNTSLEAMTFRSSLEAHQVAMKFVILNAPDNKSVTAAWRALHASYGTSTADFFYELSGAFDELGDKAHWARYDARTAAKANALTSRKDFYEAVRDWAQACFDMTQQSSPEKPELDFTDEPQDAGQMWEVCGDPHRALFHYKDHAARWAREQFPHESVAKRYARVQYRTILKFN